MAYEHEILLMSHSGGHDHGYWHQHERTLREAMEPKEIERSLLRMKRKNRIPWELTEINVDVLRSPSLILLSNKFDAKLTLVCCSKCIQFS